MTAVEKRFLTGFRSEDADTPGLVQEDDGTVWLVAPDGTRTQISGGGSVPYGSNWCRVDLNASPTLNAGSPTFKFQESDIGIHAQSGSDFTVGDTTGLPTSLAGAIISATGGWFQAACFAGAPTGALDAGSPDLRWMEFQYSIAVPDDSDFPGSQLGVDVMLPVGPTNGNLADTRVSAPGFALPGHPVLFGITLDFINVFGTDEITGPLDNFGKFVVWQVA